MEEDPVLRGSDDSQEDQELVELLLEEEEENSGRRRIIIIIIIILLLLLLFWPVDREGLRDARQEDRAERELVEKQRPAGLAKYEVISGAPNKELMGNTRKGVAVVVRFHVTNIGRQSEMLDYSMVTIKDQFGMEYSAVPAMTKKFYEEEGLKNYHWGQSIESGQKLEVLAVFIAASGPKKGYVLVGRDFEWTSEKTKEFELGTFDTLPARPYMEPDQ